MCCVKYTSDFEKISTLKKECKIPHLKIVYSLHVEIITFWVKLEHSRSKIQQFLKKHSKIL